jgi:hypothetical protein
MVGIENFATSLDLFGVQNGPSPCSYTIAATVNTYGDSRYEYLYLLKMHKA